MNKDNVSRVKAWECVGCGKIEAPQPCVGICQDRIVELMPAEAYDRLAGSCEQLAEDNAAMRELLLRLACTCPRDGQWETSYRAVQFRAQELLDTLQK